MTQHESDAVVFFNGSFLPKKDVRISPDDRGFLFADGIYEVIRCYDGRFFRADEHYARLDRSLRALRIEGADSAVFRDAAPRLLDENGMRDASLYIQVTRGAAPRTHRFPANGTPPTVYAALMPVHAHEEDWANGIDVLLVSDTRWTRCDIKSTALPANVMAKQQALDRGAGEALFVRDGVVTEGSHTNFCAVFDGTLVTYPRSNYILPGITRGVILELCQQLGIAVREAPVFEHELLDADELMILGTTTEVMPVVRVEGTPVAGGEPGPVTRRLQQAYGDHAHRGRALAR